MKTLQFIRGALMATLLAVVAMLPSEGALAQTVTSLPAYINANSVYDFGNGPLEIRMLNGNAGLFTMSATGVGSTSGSSTTLTLTASAAANPPCVGCVISGAGITSGTTVAAFNGTTGITLSAAMTVASSTPLAWGMACPTYSATLNPGPLYMAQARVDADLPFYTQARVCGISNFGPGATALPFAIGAH